MKYKNVQISNRALYDARILKNPTENRQKLTWLEVVCIFNNSLIF